MLVEISPLAHGDALFDPSAIAHRTNQTVWVKERYGKVPQLEANVGQHFFATCTSFVLPGERPPLALAALKRQVASAWNMASFGNPPIFSVFCRIVLHQRIASTLRHSPISLNVGQGRIDLAERWLISRAWDCAVGRFAGVGSSKLPRFPQARAAGWDRTRL
jgi:hypothetical protein